MDSIHIQTSQNDKSASNLEFTNQKNPEYFLFLFIQNQMQILPSK